MTPEEHAAYTQALVDTLSHRPEVRGVVLLGSTARTHHLPDAHSDHDFFVVVEEGEQNRYRESTDWLPPRGAALVHHFRDTFHGARVLYRDGHVLEYAVFTPGELAESRNHHLQVAFDRHGDLGALLEGTCRPEAPNVPALLSDLYLHLLIGARRHARGEVLAGRQMLHWATQDTLGLLRALVPAQEDRGDGRNPWRRAEQTHPAEAAAIADALTLPIPQAARRLLALVRGWAAHHPAWEEEAARAVEERLSALS